MFGRHKRGNDSNRAGGLGGAGTFRVHAAGNVFLANTIRYEGVRYDAADGGNFCDAGGQSRPLKWVFGSRSRLGPPKRQDRCGDILSHVRDRGGDIWRDDCKAANLSGASSASNPGAGGDVYGRALSDGSAGPWA